MKSFLLGLALGLGLLSGVLLWRAHQAPIPTVAEVRELLLRESPGVGWHLDEQGINNFGCRWEKSMMERLIRRLRRIDGDLSRDKYTYGNRSDAIVATVYYQEDGIERVDLLGPPASVEAFMTKLETAFPGLPCRIVGP